jgi:hypothetical protein
MEACYRGTDVMERSCAVARGIDINNNDSDLDRVATPGVFFAYFYNHAHRLCLEKLL